MALIICPECKSDISSTSSNCVHCGYTFPDCFDEISRIDKSIKQVSDQKIISRIYSDMIDSNNSDQINYVSMQKNLSNQIINKLLDLYENKVTCNLLNNNTISPNKYFYSEHYKENKHKAEINRCITSNKVTKSNILMALWKSLHDYYDTKTANNIINHPNTTVSLLNLIADQYWFTTNELFNNKLATEDILIKAFCHANIMDINERDFINLLNHPNTTENVVFEVVKRINSELKPEEKKIYSSKKSHLLTFCRLLMDSINLSYETEAYIAKSCTNDVRIVLSSYKLDDKTFRILCKDKCLEVRQIIAANRNISYEIQTQLLKDDDIGVKVSLSNNKNVYEDIAYKLAHEQNDRIHLNLINLYKDGLLNDKIAEIILLKSSYGIKEEIIKTMPNVSISLLEQLCNDVNVDNRKFVAYRCKVEDLLYKLSKDEDEFVRMAVAENPNTTINILSHMKGDSSWRVDVALMKNPKTPDSWLIDIAKKEDNSEAKKRIWEYKYDLHHGIKVPDEAFKIVIKDEEVLDWAKHYRRDEYYRLTSLS